MSLNHRNGTPVLDVWLMATVADAEIALHAESVVIGANLGDAFDRVVPDLVAELRRRVVGDES